MRPNARAEGVQLAGLGARSARGLANLARSNLRFYAQPAGTIMPSLAACPVGFAAPEGYRLANPSVALHGGRIVLLQPAVEQCHPARTRHFLLQLAEELAVESSAEVLVPPETPEAGFQDPRLFAWRDGLWCCARLVTPAAEGECEQLLACLDGRGQGPIRLTHWRVLRAQGRHQQHWMPLVKPAPGEAGAEGLQFITGCDPTRVVDDEARPILETTSAIGPSNSTVARQRSTSMPAPGREQVAAGLP
jgi:hypothetical protein